MATARDVIKSSLRLIGAISQGENPSSSELTDALATLNEMLESWSNEKLIIPFNTTETFSFVAGKQTYTMGPGGDFDTSWPIDIQKVRYKDPQIEIAIDILNLDEWASISTRDTTSTIPSKVYVENSFPLKTLNFWPVPSTNQQVILYSDKPLAAFSDASETVELPTGFLRALKYNLAVELAPEYGTEPMPTVYKIAMDAKAALKSKNIKPTYLKTNGITSGRLFDYRTGE